MNLNLSGTTWDDLVTHLVERGALRDQGDARSAYLGRGERDRSIAFNVPSSTGAQLRLGAALAEAFCEIDALVELAADGYGVHDFLNDACTDSLGQEVIVYFPGHTAQAL